MSHHLSVVSRHQGVHGVCQTGYFLEVFENKRKILSVAGYNFRAPGHIGGEAEGFAGYGASCAGSSPWH